MINRPIASRCRTLRLVTLEDSRMPAILLTNVCHLANKMDDLSVVVATHNPSVACISESWLNDNISDVSVQLSGYNLFRKGRACGNGGGVALYILT